MEIRNNSEIDYCFEMPDYIKKELTRPYGFLFTNNDIFVNFILKNKNSRLITVGDVVTSTLYEHNIIPFLSIIDGKTKRQIKVKITNENFIKIKNERSTIRFSAMKIIKNILNKNERSTILVEGEEDLLVIPVVIYGKNNDIVVYGQPNAGAVVIINSYFVRIRVKQILEKFYVKKC